ncbi:MAG TPA: hypothetical protein VGL26_00960 [Jatrophihabitans sp.]|jgi:hypothetical protein
MRTRLLAAMVGSGLIAGVLWWAWSPTRPDGWVVSTHRVAGLFTAATVEPFEEEGWAASDGRFAILMLLLGVAFALWLWRTTSLRGPVTAVLLAVGGLISSALAGLIGFLLGGGHVTGAVNEQIRTALTVHAHGLYFLQPVVGLLVYGLCAAFAREDDLGVVSDSAVSTSSTAADLVRTEGEA